MTTRHRCILCALAVAALLCGCGQTGALYLPGERVKTPVEIRTTTTPAPAPPPAQAPAQPPSPAPPAAPDEKKDAPKPPGA